MHDVKKRKISAEDAVVARRSQKGLTRRRGNAEHLSIKLKTVIPAQAGTQLLQPFEQSALAPVQYPEQLRALGPRFRGDDNFVFNEKILRGELAPAKAGTSSRANLFFDAAPLPEKGC